MLIKDGEDMNAFKDEKSLCPFDYAPTVSDMGTHVFCMPGE